MKRNNKSFVLSILVLLISCSFQVEQNSAKQIISKHKIVFNKPPQKIPASHSVDAPLLGNGRTGVAISGEPQKQVYYIARNDFWRLKSGLNESFPAVLGKLVVEIPELKEASYLIEQQLFDAKTYSRFSKEKSTVGIKSYVSAVRDWMVLEIDLKGDGELVGTVDLELPGDLEFVNNPPADVIFPSEADKGNKDGIFYISRGFSKNVDIPTKAACAFSILDKESNNFLLKQGEPVIVVVGFSSNFKSLDCQLTAQQMVDNSNKKWFNILKKNTMNGGQNIGHNHMLILMIR